MSVNKKTVLIGVALALVLAVGVAIAAPSIGSLGTTTQSTSELSGASSVLIVQLTDPPIVPPRTTSLNLTYSSMSLLVSEPSVQVSTSTTTIVTGTSTITSEITSTSTKNGQTTLQTVPVTLQSAATVDLLKLQNISQTIALANLPNGSVIYSVTFDVSSISIDVNGTVSQVTLATGGNTLLVTLARPAELSGTNALLLDLNPTIVNTTSGYQMIPSAVGVIRPHSEVNSQNDHVGDREKITNQDQNEFEQARGQVSASLMALSVSGNVTTLTVQVTNTGSTPVRLVAIAVHGNFTSQSCASIGSSSTTTSSQQDHQDSNTSSSTSTSTSSNFDYHDQQDFRHCYTPNEVVFVPVSSSSTATTTSSTSSTSSTTTTSNSCVSGQLSLVNMAGSEDGEYGNSLVVSPGQCMTLTFSGVVSFGHSGNALVPSTAAGQNYTVHVIASNGAEMKLSCTLPVSGSSCTATSSSQNNQGKDNQN